jgi:hypothetical protein
MATFSNNFGAKGAEKGNIEYNCVVCNFKCCKIYSWNRHIMTSKHIKATNVNDLATEKGQKGQIYCCENCGKEYNDRTGLWRHKKKCNINKETENQIDDKKTSNSIDKDELIIQLLKQNAKLMDILENGTHNINNNTNNTTNTHTNSHNKAFNLNFFLNETCKNAMNITDFVDSIKLQLSDLMDVGELGYVEGISKIIVKNLNNLDETIRPIHCTDKKRETMYIKDEGQWEKDENKTKLKKAVKKVANKNIRLLPQFREKYPDYGNSSKKISDTYDKIVIEAMTSDDDKNEKIVKNISKVTTIQEK